MRPSIVKGMREITEEFAWYTSKTATVEFDIEDEHLLEDADSEEAISYAVGVLDWYGFPSHNGTVYVSDEVEHEDLDDDADLRVRFATLSGFSAEELAEISARLKEL